MKTLYLDSSIVSRCAAGESPIIDIVRKSSGRIKIVTSISHIIESLPKKPEYIDASISRLRIITDKSIAIPVRSFFEIPKIEASVLSAKFLDITCEWGELYWTDDKSNIASQLQSQAREMILAKLAEIKDPNERRQQRARLFLRGKLRSAAVLDLLKSSREYARHNAEVTLPELVPIFEENGIYDAMTGNADHEKFRHIFMTTLMHPVVLAKLAFHPELEVKPISEFFWDQGSRLTDLIQAQVVNFININKPFNEFQNNIDELSMYFSSETGSLKIFRAFSEDFNCNDINNAFGTRNFVRLLYQILLKKVAAHGDESKTQSYAKSVKLSRGDYGDITHTVYQPYVDYFFCDRRTSQMLKKDLGDKENIFSCEESLICALKT